MKTRIVCIVFLLLISFSISSCSEKKGDYFSHPSCDPPCFLGIVPSETKTMDAKELLMSSQIVNPSSVNGFGMITKKWFPIMYSFEWEFNNKSKGVIWLSSESKVAYIDYIDPKINLRQFIEKYGDPSAILVVPYWGKKTYAYLLYPEIGIILEINKSLNGQNELRIQKTDSVNSITYVDKDFFLRLIHFYVFGDVYVNDPQIGLIPVLQPWVGFEKYNYIKIPEG